MTCHQLLAPVPAHILHMTTSTLNVQFYIRTNFENILRPFEVDILHPSPRHHHPTIQPHGILGHHAELSLPLTEV